MKSNKIKELCEICGNKANRKCKKCEVTFYCCLEHENMDKLSIHIKACNLLSKIRSKPILTNKKILKKQEKTKLKLIEELLQICLNDSEFYLLNKEYELAIPSSLQALKCGRKLFGEFNIKLITIILILCQSCLGSSKYKQAREFLSLGRLILHKNNSNDYLLKSQFHRLYGELYYNTKNYKNAMNELANDIYYSSLIGGPMNIRTAIGYYQMSKVLIKIENNHKALKFYDKIIIIWSKFLQECINNNINIKEELGSNQIIESKIMLNDILKAKEKILEANIYDTNLLNQVIIVLDNLGLLYKLDNDLVTAKKFYQNCLQLSQRIYNEKHEIIIKTQTNIQQIQDLIDV